MKKLLLLTVLSLFATTGHANQKAITDTGAEVILKSDGTWVYANADAKPKDTAININNAVFSKSKNQTFQLKSTKNDAAIWLDPSKWSFRKPAATAPGEYEFQLKGRDLYGMAITEGVQIGIEALADVALVNARSADPDAAVVKREYRVVNGRKLIFQELAGTIQSIPFTYLGYYYSDASGSTQFITYTGSNLVDKYRPEITEFLNGLVTQ